VRDPTAREGVLFWVHDDVGRKLDASLRVERIGAAWTIVVESRGGTRGSSGERNTEYKAGLTLILGRIGAAGLKIADVLVDSRDTSHLPAAQRRVLVDGETYPITVADAALLCRKISAAQGRVGRAPAARGPGNATKRLRIFLGAP
jgi:hypothetical protein